MRNQKCSATGITTAATPFIISNLVLEHQNQANWIHYLQPFCLEYFCIRNHLMQLQRRFYTQMQSKKRDIKSEMQIASPGLLVLPDQSSRVLLRPAAVLWGPAVLLLVTGRSWGPWQQPDLTLQDHHHRSRGWRSWSSSSSSRVERTAAVGWQL